MLLSDLVITLIALLAFSFIAGKRYGIAYQFLLSFCSIGGFCALFLVSYGIASII